MSFVVWINIYKKHKFHISTFPLRALWNKLRATDEGKKAFARATHNKWLLVKEVSSMLLIPGLLQNGISSLMKYRTWCILQTWQNAPWNQSDHRRTTWCPSSALAATPSYSGSTPSGEVLLEIGSDVDAWRRFGYYMHRAPCDGKLTRLYWSSHQLATQPYWREGFQRDAYHSPKAEISIETHHDTYCNVESQLPWFHYSSLSLLAFPLYIGNRTLKIYWVACCRIRWTWVLLEVGFLDQL